MSNTFWLTEDAAAIGAELIQEVKTHHHLGEAKIAYLFADKATKRGEVVTLATVSVCSPKDRALHKHDLMVVIASEPWKGLTKDQRVALIDHELCHFERATKRQRLSPKRSREFNADDCDGYIRHEDGEDGRITVWTTMHDPDGRPLWRKRYHDVEDFAEVIERRGLWSQGLREAAEVVQTWLPGFEVEQKPAPKRTKDKAA